ncbi:MAG: translation initiation factor IF-2, partial [Anaerovoracaceae bacterium]|nr:translation initiation factor IF-2 [Anaerovoracaceae bacterium]
KPAKVETVKKSEAQAKTDDAKKADGKPTAEKNEEIKVGTVIARAGQDNYPSYNHSPRGEGRDSRERRDFNSRDNRDNRDSRGNRDHKDGRRDNRNDNRGSRDGKNPHQKDLFKNDRGNDRNNRNDRGDRNDRRNSDGLRKDGDRRNNGGKSFGSRTQRGDKPILDKLEVKTDHTKRAEHKKNQDKYDKSKHDKFNKFEKAVESKKNLEKKARKKHVKAKPQVEEVEIMEETLPEGTIVINVPITVAGFCEQTEVSQAKVIMSLMKLGIMANINQNIDEDTVSILADDLGIDVVIGKVMEETVEEGLETFEDREEDLKQRPPIITVMGHVDHGKTSLLDAIRKTNVTSMESGGITQHIGASEVSINGQKIVFLDTPGHEAFTAMRARGAHVTDIAVLVVAADDSVKPQTIESISHAKAAGVPIIVAINKMDKPAANPDRVKQDLTEHGILVEDWGGDIISVPVSAKSGEGIVNLLEMILLQAEMLELKANPSRLALGSVIEARLDKAKGPVATLLVTNGTLHTGQSVVAGTCSGRIRLMTDFKGKTIKKAGPATAVEILGLTEVPQAGDEFNAVKEDRIAREIAESRKNKLREEVLARNASSTLEKLFSQIKEGEVKELNLIIKGDVQGSVGALVASLEKLNNENVRVNIIHTGVGTVNESDVTLAGTTGSIIIGFNVRPSTAVTTFADRENIEIRTYRVIYDVIDDVENAMKGMLDPEFKEEVLGKVEIRNTFKVPGVGIIGGAYVTEGKVTRNAEVRLVRDGIVIHEGKISSLKRFKDDAKEVATGFECGIGIEAYNDIKEGDVIECFHMVEIERK